MNPRLSVSTPRFLEPEVVGIGRAANRHEQVTAHHLRGARIALHLNGNSPVPLLHGNAPRPETNLDPFAPHHLPHRLGHVVVVSPDEPILHLHDRDQAPEAAIHLRELEPYIAAADDDQMFGHVVQLHHGRIGQVVDLVQAGDRGDERARAGIDEDPLGLQPLAVDTHRMGVLEARVSLVDRAVGHVPEPGGHALARLPHDGVLAGLDAPHVDVDRAIDHDAEVVAPAGHVRGPGARDQRFGGNASDIHAGAAEQLALDDGRLQTFPGQSRRH